MRCCSLLQTFFCLRPFARTSRGRGSSELAALFHRSPTIHHPPYTIHHPPHPPHPPSIIPRHRNAAPHNTRNAAKPTPRPSPLLPPLPPPPSGTPRA
ncbi:hypothetical protein F5882DRAFT_403430 [Hyaloscypha sp. PMI_1271]|nr:hypothetical protein F5882DRAFT_403430 [Hyaloscypha sp. PMI_1271]